MTAAGVSRYRRLDAAAVSRTVERLHERIAARFPTRGLRQVAIAVAEAVDLVVLEGSARRRRQSILRVACLVGVGVILVAVVFALALTLIDALGTAGARHATDWVPLVESLINDLAFAAIAIFFLVSVPNRLRRRRTLAILHELRSLAHVVDMHQLTKDPERFLSATPATEASIAPDLDLPGLGRYLDYCSELLSLVAKTAGLCAQEESDPLVLDTVSEIETLTLGMSRKVWQKISLLHQNDRLSESS